VVSACLAWSASAATIKCAYDLAQNRYNLGALVRPASNPYQVYRASITRFSFNVCDAVGGCGANLPSAACKTTSIGGMETAIGDVKSSSVHRLTPADVKYINQKTGHKPLYTLLNGGQGVKIVYPAMQSYGAAGVVDEAVTVMIPCDPTAQFPTPLKYLAGAKYETAAEGFIFVLPSVHGCPTNKPLPSMSEEPLSFGWVFIILSAVSITVYLGVGIGYKMHKYGVRGVEAVPHIDFWREVPYLVKEGLVFSQQRCQECDSGVPRRAVEAVKGNSYDAVL